MALTEIETKPVEAITEYSKTEAGLSELRSRLQGVVYDVTTGKGMEVAKKDRAEVRSLRTGLETMRKEIKAPALAHCKLIDDEAKRITAALLALEEPIDATIKAEEARKEAERVAKEAVERTRITAIHQKIAEITSYVALAHECRTSDRVRSLLDKVEANWASYGDIWEDTFEEFCEESQNAYNDTKARLLSIIETKQATERESAELQAYQEEQAAAVAAERAALAIERKAAQVEMERAAALVAATVAAQKAEAKAASDNLAAERAAFEAERAAVRAADEARAAAETAALQRDTFAADYAALAQVMSVDETPEVPAPAVDIEQPEPTDADVLVVACAALVQAFGWTTQQAVDRLSSINWSQA